jgi:hypothetical protein
VNGFYMHFEYEEILRAESRSIGSVGATHWDHLWITLAAKRPKRVSAIRGG